MLCIGLILVWCSSQALPPATAGAPFCEIYSPILWSTHDTRKTKEQVDQLNRVWKQLCRRGSGHAAKN
jgi:hypothetical protein